MFTTIALNKFKFTLKFRSCAVQIFCTAYKVKVNAQTLTFAAMPLTNTTKVQTPSPLYFSCTLLAKHVSYMTCFVQERNHFHFHFFFFYCNLILNIPEIGNKLIQRLNISQSEPQHYKQTSAKVVGEEGEVRAMRTLKKVHKH